MGLGRSCWYNSWRTTGIYCVILYCTVIYLYIEYIYIYIYILVIIGRVCKLLMKNFMYLIEMNIRW